MNRLRLLSLSATVLGVVILAASDGHGQPGGKGGFGPPGGQTRKILKDFDKDGNGWLSTEERQPARTAAKSTGRGKGGFGKGGRGEPGKPGPKVKPDEVAIYPDRPLYDPAILRTIFLDFDRPDWESELEDFHGTDVDVTARLTVDGKVYPNVGVHFRGMSSYMSVPAGSKRSLNVSLDLADSKQRLYGAKTLNLLNGHGDSSFLSTALYSHIARKHIPTPNANMVKVVINGESWGIYANVQQFDKVFSKENYKSDKGTRWKVRGSPGTASGLEYLGENIEDYRRRYEIKSADTEAAWKALIHFCKVLNTTPPDRLEEALKPIADVEGILWFLALDVALINSDGYWIRSSDYSIYLDEHGKFHIIPHDMNEAFRPGGGPGMGGGRGGMGGGPGGPGGPGGFGPGGPMGMAPPRPGEVLPGPLVDALRTTPDQKKQLEELQKEVDARLEKLLTADQRKELQAMREAGPFGPPPGGGFGPGGPGGFGPGGPGGFGPGGPGGGMGGGGLTLDPLVGLTDPRKPLRSKLLAVPSLRERYLVNIRQIAREDLDWSKLGPVVAAYRQLIEKELEIDTRKLNSIEAFRQATADQSEAGRGREMSLRGFADARRKFLLEYREPTAPR